MMAKGFVVCAVLCTLLHVLSAAVVLEAPQLQKALVQQKYAHLQPEIDEWKRLGHPTTAAFAHKDGVAEIGNLIAVPDKVTLQATDDVSQFVTFHFYNRENPNGTIVAPDAESFKAAGFNPDKPTKIIIHGFANNIESGLFGALVPAVLKNSDCNAIAVDWGILAVAPLYLEARNNVPKVGKVVAGLIDELALKAGLEKAKLHLMGHSLGAHVSGCAGQQLQSEGKIGRITGMDPAQPLFLVLTQDRLTKNDATLVDIIHSCGGLLGLAEAIGHVDFYPNGGQKPQPGCGLDPVGDCSHSRSWEYMAESGLEDGAFLARECDSQAAALLGLCGDTVDANMGMNVEYNENGSGTYYLKTAETSPFDLVYHARALVGQ